MSRMFLELHSLLLFLLLLLHAASEAGRKYSNGSRCYMRQAKLDASIVMVGVVLLGVLVGILWNWTDRPADRLASEAA